MSTATSEVPQPELNGNPPPMVGEVNLAELATFCGLSQSGPVLTSLKVSRASVIRSDKLAKKPNKYIVPFNGFFYYINLPFVAQSNSSFAPRGNHLFTFTPPDNVRLEGFVVIEKDYYYVTLKDLQRGIVRKSRLLTTKKAGLTYEELVNGTFRNSARSADGASNLNSSDVSGGSGSAGDALSAQLSGVGSDFNLEELKAVELAFAKQESALFGADVEEEEYDEEEEGA